VSEKCDTCGQQLSQTHRAFFRYRCRQCGIIFESRGSLPVEHARTHLQHGLAAENHIANRIDSDRWAFPRLIHQCNVEDCGVAELIGYQIRKVPRGPTEE
jgi:hypothetical protein